MSIFKRLRPSDKPTQSAPLTEAQKQAEPGHYFSPAQAPEKAQLTVRRAPSLPAFAVTGLILGLLLAFPVTLMGPENPNYDFWSVYGVMAVICGTACTTVFLLLALLLDRISARKTRTFQAVSSQD